MSAFAGVVTFAGDAPHHAGRFIATIDGHGLGRPVTRRVPGGVFVFRQHVDTPEDRWEHQPSLGSLSQVVSLFDGRLDNRSELLAELGQVSTTASPLPDGELVRLAYERWETEAVPRLLGDFAWAIWDGRQRRLMLSRDHSVFRSLYYSPIPGGMAFATAYRPLLALPEVSRELDLFVVGDNLATSPQEDEGTIYRAISWVGSAARVVADGNGIRTDRHWIPESRPTLRLKRDEDYVEAARAMFDQAIACRLRRIGPVVVALSGGHDSSALAATLARRLAPETIHGLTMVPSPLYPSDANPNPNTYAHERPKVEALAELYPNLAVEYLTCPTDHPLESHPQRMFATGGISLRSSGNFIWFQPMLERGPALGTRTVFCGNYGNYTFSANGITYIADLARSGRWGAALREAALARKFVQPQNFRAMLRSLAANHCPNLLTLSRRIRGIRPEPPWLPKSAINREFYNNSGFGTRAERETITSQDSMGPNGYARIMRYVTFRSRMQMDACSLVRITTGTDSRDPYVDRRVLDFCLSLPPDQFMRDGVQRHLSRRMFADRLPPQILNEPLRGLQNTDWFLRLDHHRDAIAQELDRMASSSLARQVLDIPALKQLLADLPHDIAVAERKRGTYIGQFSRALLVGRFLSWYEGSNH